MEVSVNSKVYGTHVLILDDCDSDLVQKKNLRLEKGRTTFYARVANGPSVHKLVLSRALGRRIKPGEIIDHVNGNGLDCRRQNLRLVTTQQNAQNRKGPNRNNVNSRHRNVYYEAHLDKWRVRLMVNGKLLSFGTFDTIAEAVAKAEKARQEAGFLTDKL